MKTTLPNSIVLLQTISEQMLECESFFTPNSKDFKLLQHVIKESDILDQDERFLGNPNFIRYIQLVMLAGLSMLGGVFIPTVKSFSNKDNQISITWDTGATTAFMSGAYNKKFKDFALYYQDRLSSKPQNRSHIPTSILIGIDGFISSYITVLKAVDKRINPLLENKQNVITLLDSNINRDLLFILISSLPPDQINALFLYIQNFFPEDLTITTPQGQTIQVVSLFEKNSVDVVYLIEKTKIYCDLYFSTSMPIIKQITQSKTTEFMKKSLQSDEVFKQTQQTLKQLKLLQVDARLQLYTALNQHFSQILN